MEQRGCLLAERRGLEPVAGAADLRRKARQRCGSLQRVLVREEGVNDWRRGRIEVGRETQVEVTRLLAALGGSGGLTGVVVERRGSLECRVCLGMTGELLRAAAHGPPGQPHPPRVVAPGSRLHLSGQRLECRDGVGEHGERRRRHHAETDTFDGGAHAWRGRIQDGAIAIVRVLRRARVPREHELPHGDGRPGATCRDDDALAGATSREAVESSLEPGGIAGVHARLAPQPGPHQPQRFSRRARFALGAGCVGDCSLLFGGRQVEPPPGPCTGSRQHGRPCVGGGRSVKPGPVNQGDLLRSIISTIGPCVVQWVRIQSASGDATMSMSLRVGLAWVLAACVVHAQPASQPVPPGGARKAVLVTGASTGIGRTITEKLAADGHFVYAGARKPADLEALGKIPNVQAVRLDVTNAQDIADAVATITKAGRGLYGVVNNAGVAVAGPFLETTEDDMQYVMNINAYGPWRITKAFAPLVIAAKGRIVTIGSISGILSSGSLGVYSMSKHAVEAFTDSLATQMAPLGVAVSVIEPGNYASEIMRTAVQRSGGDARAADRSQYKPPDEVAASVSLALFEATPKRRYMTVPNANEGEITIRKAIEELVQLNEGHAYTYDRATLVAMLDAALAKARPKAGTPVP